MCSVQRTRQACCIAIQQVDVGRAGLARMLGQVHHRHAQAVARIAADRRIDLAVLARCPIALWASARYWRLTSRAAIIATSASMALRLRATTIRPLVSLSRR